MWICLAVALWVYGFALATCNLLLVGSLLGFPILAALLTAWGSALFSGSATAEGASHASLLNRSRWETPLGIALVALSICGFSGCENWRGRRAGLQAETELKSRGELTTSSPLGKTTVPGDQNVMAHLRSCHFIFMGRCSQGPVRPLCELVSLSFS